MNEPETRAPASSHIAGIILAAGESSRMGRHKALLRLGPATFVEHLAEALRADANPLCIVLGYRGAEIEGHLPPWLRPHILHNPDYKLGQLSSLKVALAALLHEEPRQPVDAALVCLVDTPAISSRVVRALIAEFRRTSAPVVIPTCAGRRGHPVLFARTVFDQLLEAPLEQGARAVVQQHADQVQLVETGEEGILLDIDRPEDYAALLSRWPALSAETRKQHGEPG